MHKLNNVGENNLMSSLIFRVVLYLREKFTLIKIEQQSKLKIILAKLVTKRPPNIISAKKYTEKGNSQSAHFY